MLRWSETNENKSFGITMEVTTKTTNLRIFGVPSEIGTEFLPNILTSYKPSGMSHITSNCLNSFPMWLVMKLSQNIQIDSGIFNHFRSYIGPSPTLWFSCSRSFSWSLTLSNPIFLPLAYSPVLIYFGRKRDWWVTCNYPTVLKEENINRKNTTCAICSLKFVLHEYI
jgi:hypothetical protein